jgi:hypothetical protein
VYAKIVFLPCAHFDAGIDTRNGDLSEAAERSIRETLAAHKDCLSVTYEHVFIVL